MKTSSCVGGIALLGTAVLEMVGGAMQAITEPAAPTLVGGQIGRLPVQIPRLSISALERLSTFARTGANLTVALVLLAAIVVVAIWKNRDQRSDDPSGLAPSLILVSAILASIVIVVNVAMCIEVLKNATGLLSGGRPNRAASFFEFLAPVGLSITVLWCASIRPRSPIASKTLAEVSAD